MTLSMNVVVLLYLVASVFFIQALKGLSHPTTSRRGNVFGMAGMAIAVLTTVGLIAKLAEGAAGAAGAGGADDDKFADEQAGEAGVEVARHSDPESARVGHEGQERQFLGEEHGPRLPVRRIVRRARAAADRPRRIVARRPGDRPKAGARGFTRGVAGVRRGGGAGARRPAGGRRHPRPDVARPGSP